MNTPRSFLDLDVDKSLYSSGIVVHREVMPKLPKEEKFGLVDQLSRSTKSPPALIAEGYAKKHQKGNWKKYLNDCLGECNESIVHLSFIKDLYGYLYPKGLLDGLIKQYDIDGKRVYRLAQSWSSQETHSSPPFLDSQLKTHNPQL